MRVCVEEGHVQAFCRALDRPVPGRGEIVPPTFVAALLHLDPDHLAGLRPRGPMAVRACAGGSVVAAEQGLELLAPLRVGDLLDVDDEEPRTWQRTDRRGQVLHLTELVQVLRSVAPAEPQHPGQVVARSRVLLVERPLPT